MTSKKEIAKRKAKYKRIKELVSELEDLLWNTEEDAKSPSCKDWVAWQNMELKTLRINYQNMVYELEGLKNELKILRLQLSK